MSMITAVKLEDQRTTGKGPGQADGTHGRLGPGGDQPDLFNGRDTRNDPFRQFDFGLGGGPVAGSPCGCLLDRLYHPGMSMTQYKGSPGSHIIQISVSIRIKDPGAFGPTDKQRVGADGLSSPYRTVDPPGNNGLTSFKKRFRPFQKIIHENTSSSSSLTLCN